MQVTRGAAVFLAGLGLWIASRLVGSPDLHMVAVGLVVLPFASALLARWSGQHLAVRRRVSSHTAVPGQRITVDITVENRSALPTPFVLLEDRASPGLGPPARMVLTGLPGRASQDASYGVSCRTRGRYRLGPLVLDIADPFLLTRMRIEVPLGQDLVIYPEVEPLVGGVAVAHRSSGGGSRARVPFRAGEEFYTMREYQIGDDLRRIHWPSTARQGRLMIRQDEAARRASATVLLDTRASSLGLSGSPAFEKAVSAAASVGVLLHRNGFSVRLATADALPIETTEEGLLTALATVQHSRSRSLAATLLALRMGRERESTLAVVTALPGPSEVALLTRAGAAFGPRVAVLIYPTNPADVPPEQGAELEGRASVARGSLVRAGWDVYVLPPTGRLQDAWLANRTRLPVATAASR